MNNMMDNRKGFMGLGMVIGGVFLLVLILLSIWFVKKISNKT